MPELPGVEKIRRSLGRGVIRKEITSFIVFNARVLKGEEKLFKQNILGSYFKSFERWGKVIIGKLASGYYLFFYLHSAGDLVYNKEDIRDKYTKVVFEFKNGLKLFLNDKRADAYLKILNDKQRKRLLVDYGVRPLSKEFNYIRFRQVLRNKTTNIKNFLTNQAYIAGVGDVYGDEILFEARVKPDRGVKTLKDSEMKRLYGALRKVLKKFSKYGSDIFYVYEREGDKCIRCKVGIIKKEKVSNRWTYYCPLCQN